MEEREKVQFLSLCIKHFLQQPPNKFSPSIIFLPISPQANMKSELDPIITGFHIPDWSLTTISGDQSKQDAILHPILQLIREMLYLDETLLNLNARLPEADRLPQVGNYLIPEFLHEVPKIEKFYQFIAEIAEPEEFSDIHSIQASNLPFMQFNSSKLNRNEFFKIILIVLGKIIKDLFEIDGMIILFDQVQNLDPMTLSWLEFAVSEHIPKSLPLLFIALYPEDSSSTFLHSWRDSAQYFSYEEYTAKSNKKKYELLLKTGENNRHSPSEIVKIISEIRILYDHLAKNGYT